MLNLFKKQNRYFFTSLQTTNFPYVFGGIPSKPANQNLEAFVTRIFGQETKTGFQTAYNAVLSALESQDKALLTSTLEPGLTKNLSFQPVKHINSINPLKISIPRGYIGLGFKFIRTGQQSSQKMRQVNGFQFLVNFINPSMDMKLPMIAGFQVMFEGNNKLIQSNQTQNDTNQIHSMQFQIQNTISVIQVTSLMQKVQGQQGSMMNSLQTMKGLFFGQNWQWRITDIDGVLKGNLPNLKQ